MFVCAKCYTWIYLTCILNLMVQVSNEARRNEEQILMMVIIQLNKTLHIGETLIKTGQNKISSQHWG